MKNWPIYILQSPSNEEGGGPWEDRVIKVCEQVHREIRGQKRSSKIVEIFSPPLHFTFTKGLQSEEEWFLAYGPRNAGAEQLELRIFEPQAPDLCFNLKPKPEGGTLFSTDHEKIVLINGKSQKTVTLSDGDVITIGNTEITVRFCQ